MRETVSDPFARRPDPIPLPATRRRWAMTVFALRPDHPAADLHDALDEPLWEALAAAAVENVLVAATEPAVEARLVRMGLLFASGLPTAAGYALLLRWHRAFKGRHRSRWWAPKAALTRHEVRMRAMWGC